jgi:hypothetical protein
LVMALSRSSRMVDAGRGGLAASVDMKVAPVIASEAKQSSFLQRKNLDCFVAPLLAMTTNGI